MDDGRPRHGEELGTATASLGDDPKKGGENVWISRIAIDLARGVAQSVVSSETRARRTSSEHRKVGAREARREAARQNGGKPRERCRAGSRKGSEPRKGGVTGVGRRIRPEMVRGASRWLPWSRRDRPGPGLSDTIPARCQRPVVDVAPRSTGGFGRTVTRGCVASGAWSAPSPCEGSSGIGASGGRPRAWPGARPPPPGGSARPGRGRDRRDA
jgi:hypothetical protein